MQLRTITTLPAFDELAGEWNDLLACCSASHVPFLRHEYLRAWWQTLGGGEWSPAGAGSMQPQVCVVAGFDQDNQLTGAAPLFFAQNRQGEPALLLLGSIEISDYLDLVVGPADLPIFVDALFALLDSDQAPGWQAMDWYNIPETSPTLPALKEAAERRGWSYAQERLQPCPNISLPGDWEIYLTGIDKKQRHEIRRKMRRAEENPVPVRWYIIGGAERSLEANSLEVEVEDFMSLMAQDPEKERFLTPLMRAQMHSAAQAAFQSGWLQLAFLEVGGVKAAGYLNFDYAGHIWVYNSGLNFELRELSPGWVLLGYLLKWANENHRLTFDFMRGDEDYKYRFGGINRYIVRAIVRR